MSLVGNRIAVVSLGSSCQPAHQLKGHAQFISEIVDDELKHTRLPFDWVISPIARTTEWLRSENLFPVSPGDLASLAGQNGAFLWEEQGVYFWHDFRSYDGNIDLEGTFERTRISYELGFANLRDLRKLERIIVVVANTQNNVPCALGPSYPSDGFDFTVPLLKHFKDTVDGSFGRRTEMLCVTYADRCSNELQSMPDLDIVVSRISRDTSGWAGDPAEWKRILLEYFTIAIQRAPISKGSRL